MLRTILRRKFIIPTIVFAVLYTVLTTYMMNVRLLKFALLGSFSLEYKARLLLALLGGMWTAMSGFGLTMLIIVALLTGANLTLIIQRIVKLRSFGKLHFVAGGSSLLGGDLFHDTGAPCSLFNALYDIFKAYPCPIISAVGNHDMDNYNLDTWYTHSGLGSLVRSGVLLVEDVLEIGEDWRITTFHAGTEKAKLLISGGYNPLLYDGDKYEVAVAHIPVGPKSIGHIKGVNELYIPGFDVLCVADIHEQIPPTTTITGCIVVNPGPLERRSLTEKDLKCEVALIDNDLNVKYIPWGAPEASEVFRLVEDLEQEIGAEFFEVLREIREQPDQPLSEQIRDMAMHLGTTSAAFNLLLSEVGIG